MLQLQSELRAIRVASQQAQERALRLESELSAAQDWIGAAERKAAQAERRQSSLQKRMDDWDADVFGPSAPRTRRRLSPLSQSPRRRGCRLRSPMRTPACCQPFGSGTVQRRAAVACRLRFTPRSAPDRWLSGEERARRMARRSDEYSAHSRCYSTQPHSTKTEESRITRCKKGTIIKGRPPFCHHQCSRTAARPRAALPRCNVQSTMHVPTT